ncbi:unnamed protein product [Sphagnum tenellum]
MAMGSVMAYTPGSQYGSLCPMAASPALSFPSCFVSRRQLFQPRVLVKRLASWQHRPSTIQASDSLYMGIIVCQREIDCCILIYCSKSLSEFLTFKYGARLLQAEMGFNSMQLLDEGILFYLRQKLVIVFDGGKGMEEHISDIHSTREFVDALANASDKLVVVDFYPTWCGSCRALYPKVNINENKSMCKSLNIKVLPFFHFYRGAEGHIDSFSCSLSKLQKLKDAIAQHNTARCSMGPPVGVGNLFSVTTDDHATAGS